RVLAAVLYFVRRVVRRAGRAVFQRGSAHGVPNVPPAAAPAAGAQQPAGAVLVKRGPAPGAGGGPWQPGRRAPMAEPGSTAGGGGADLAGASLRVCRVGAHGQAAGVRAVAVGGPGPADSCHAGPGRVAGPLPS